MKKLKLKYKKYFIFNKINIDKIRNIIYNISNEEYI